MPKIRTIHTAESVSPKHPDKMCDQISDAILDAYLAEDPYARVAVDVAGGHGVVFITGEVTSVATSVDIDAIVKRIVGGADSTTSAPQDSFKTHSKSPKPLKIIKNIAQQSPEIAAGVDGGGAGDQGIMVGYACSETPEFLPLEYVLARNLNKFLYKIWPSDGKTQITLENGVITTVVASFQYALHKKLEQAVRQWLKQEPLAKISEKQPPKLHINPAGDWNIGGFDADAGLTGRKLAVDNYGPRVPIGGGAFSGKDSTKVDRSGAYMARKIAVDYLKKHAAKEVFVYLAYAIGFPEPVEATVTIDGVQQAVTGYDLTPEGIINQLDLRKPRFEELARWGHF